MSPRLALLVPLLACAAASAQTAPPVQESQPLDPKKNQKIERIRVEDDAVRIDEVRVGGQTQSIHVQPKKGGMPAYEVQPADMGRSSLNTRDGLSSAGGRRVWNVFDF
jgi:hypothetical protein